MSALPKTSRDELPWAHPMGWWPAFFFGLAYGLVVGGVTYAIWTAVTQSAPDKYGDVIAGFLFAMCFSIPLLIEADERSRIKKGTARDIRSALHGR